MDRKNHLILDLARIFVGTPWNKTGSALVLIGATAITGWVDQVAAQYLGFNLKQTDAWIGFALVVAGIWMLWHGRITPDDEKVRDQLALVGVPQLQRDFVRIGPKIMIEKARFAIVLRNNGPLALSYTISDFRTVIEGQTAPHEQTYPCAGPTLMPGESSNFNADLIRLDGVECGPITGEVHFDISYGRDGREKWRFKRGLKFEITFDPSTCDVRRQTCNVTRDHWTYIV